MIGRSDHAWRVRPEARRCEHLPSTYLSKLWFDTVVHDARTLRALVDVAGAERVVLGSDYPFDMGLDDPVSFVQDAELFDEVTRRIVSQNAAELLRTRVRA